MKCVFVTVPWALDELTIFLFIFVWACKFPSNTASLNIGLLHLLISFLYSWHRFSDTGNIDLSSLTVIHCFFVCWHFCPVVYSDCPCIEVSFIHYKFPFMNCFRKEFVWSLSVSVSYACVHTQVNGESMLGSLYYLHFPFWYRLSLWNCSLPIWLDWLASEPLVSTVSLLPWSCHDHACHVKSMPVLKITLPSLVRNYISIVLLLPICSLANRMCRIVLLLGLIIMLLHASLGDQF